MRASLNLPQESTEVSARQLQTALEGLAAQWEQVAHTRDGMQSRAAAAKKRASKVQDAIDAGNALEEEKLR